MSGDRIRGRDVPEGYLDRAIGPELATAPAFRRAALEILAEDHVGSLPEDPRVRGVAWLHRAPGEVQTLVAFESGEACVGEVGDDGASIMIPSDTAFIVCGEDA